jgi:methanogenic corrinoid protein MtbC1
MSDSERFVAQVLETGAVGFSGLTASLLLERRPEVARRYEPDGFTRWKAQFQQWLLDLSAAIDAGEPALFEARILWSRRAFVARGATVEDLQAALEALHDTLRDRLPAGAAGRAVATVERALAALADPQAVEDGDLDPAEPAGRSALSFLETTLAGDPRAAIDQLCNAVDGGTSVQDAYLKVLLPAQRAVGRMWHHGELSIAEEHLVTTTAQRAMTLLCERARTSSPVGKTVVLACVTSNIHDMGLRVASDFFEMAGWRTINLGPDVPDEEIARGVQVFDADVVVLAATLDRHLRVVQRSIERIRALKDRPVKIVVGGPAFDRVPDLGRKLGADGYAPRIEDVEPLASRLSRS